MSIIPSKQGTVQVPLTVLRLWPAPDGPAEPSCLACEGHLLLHQPDTNAPERLLGTCQACGAWHLIDCDRGIKVLMPDVESLRNAGPDR